LPVPVYESLRELSRSSGRSVNSLIVEALSNLFRVRGTGKLYDAFSELGLDRGSNVAFALTAQREATARSWLA